MKFHTMKIDMDSGQYTKLIDDECVFLIYQIQTTNKYHYFHTDY